MLVCLFLPFRPLALASHAMMQFLPPPRVRHSWPSTPAMLFGTAFALGFGTFPFPSSWVTCMFMFTSISAICYLASRLPAESIITHTSPGTAYPLCVHVYRCTSVQITLWVLPTRLPTLLLQALPLSTIAIARSTLLYPTPLFHPASLLDGRPHRRPCGVGTHHVDLRYPARSFFSTSHYPYRFHVHLYLFSINQPLVQSYAIPLTKSIELYTTKATVCCH